MGKELAESLEAPVPQAEIDAATEDAPVVETPETPEEPKAEAKAEEKPEKVVPLAALHEERQRRKELQAEMARERQERAAKEAVIQDRLNQMWQAQNPGPQFRDPNSDPDPLAAMAHNQQLTVQQLNELRQERQVQEARARQHAQTQQLVGWAQHQAREFAQEAPDFASAYKHMLSARRGELEAMGMDAQQVAQTLEDNELWVYQTAAQQGKNPAEMIYNMAKAAGYQKQAEQSNPEQKVAALQKGVAASKTLGTSASSGRPTAEQIANMSEDEFAELKASLKKQGKTMSDVL